MHPPDKAQDRIDPNTVNHQRVQIKNSKQDQSDYCADRLEDRRDDYTSQKMEGNVQRSIAGSRRSKGVDDWESSTQLRRRPGR